MVIVRAQTTDKQRKTWDIVGETEGPDLLRHTFERTDLEIIKPELKKDEFYRMCITRTNHVCLEVQFTFIRDGNYYEDSLTVDVYRSKFPELKLAAAYTTSSVKLTASDILISHQAALEKVAEFISSVSDFYSVDKEMIRIFLNLPTSKKNKIDAKADEKKSEIKSQSAMIQKLPQDKKELPKTAPAVLEHVNSFMPLQHNNVPKTVSITQGPVTFPRLKSNKKFNQTCNGKAVAWSEQIRPK